MDVKSDGKPFKGCAKWANIAYGAAQVVKLLR